MSANTLLVLETLTQKSKISSFPNSTAHFKVEIRSKLLRVRPKFAPGSFQFHSKFVPNPFKIRPKPYSTNQIQPENGVLSVPLYVSTRARERASFRKNFEITKKLSTIKIFDVIARVFALSQPFTIFLLFKRDLYLWAHSYFLKSSSSQHVIRHKL